MGGQPTRVGTAHLEYTPGFRLPKTVVWMNEKFQMLLTWNLHSPSCLAGFRDLCIVEPSCGNKGS